MARKAAIRTRRLVLDDAALRVPYPGNNPALKKAFPRGFPPSVGSSICCKGKNRDGSIDFWFVTDRGPNCDSPDFVDADGVQATKVFPSPDYAPSFGVLRLQQRKLRVLWSKPLKTARGARISGRPRKGGVGSTGEIALSDELNVLPFDAHGLDPEGIALAHDGLWIGDEYGPFLARVNPKSGRIVEKLAPGRGLPQVLLFREPNRGFEAVAVTPGGMVAAMLQSVLRMPDDGKRSAAHAPFIRMTLFDPATRATRMVAYPHDRKEYENSNDGKIGDLAALSDTRFVLVEQGKLKRDGVVHHRVYLVDIEHATELSGRTHQGYELEYLRPRELRAAGIVFARKQLLCDLNDFGWSAEKAEGLALLPDGQTLAVINDNDYGLTAKIVDARGREYAGNDARVDARGKITREGKDRGPYRYVMGAKTKREQRTQMWLVKFPKKLLDYEIP